MAEKALVVIGGPTAIGKTSTAIELARHFNTEIISADSRQFFKEMSIGTAKPTAADLKAAPHHFIGHLSINEYYNVSRFEQDVLRLLKDLFRTHDLVVMTGGSGLYIDAVCRGIDELPDADADLRKELNRIFCEEGIGGLQKRLQKHDPDYYETVDKQNPKRLMRALEVCLQTGEKYSELRKNSAAQRDFTIIRTGLNTSRQKLFDRINSRVDQMIEEGLFEEGRLLMPFKNLNALNTVGYKEVFAFFEGQYTQEEAIEKIKTNTRRYAKRQLTWMKKDTDIKWFEVGQTDRIIAYVEQVYSGL